MATAAHLPSGVTVDLAAVLARREARVAERRALLARCGHPVVTLSLVNPGPVKDGTEAGFAFEVAVSAIGAALSGAGFPVAAAEERRLPTGPEAHFAVAGDPVALKRLLVGLEERHPLGRLWDADVVDAGGQAIGRAALGLPGRACLVCAEPAHACARAKRHDLPELTQSIRERIDAYRRGTPA